MKLQKPGAGLPQIEKGVIRYFLVPIVRVLFTWNIALLYLKSEVEKIKKLVESLEKELLTKQPIIDRTFAIEDDSRRYSINMVLEHLTITGTGVMGVIKTLSNEQEFTRALTIEGVKANENKQEQLKEFIEFYESYFSFIENLPKIQSKATKKHPWFVNFNNYDWNIFMFMHTFIHRRQIEAIIKKLGEQNVK